MSRGGFDFDVITGPAPRPAPKPQPKPTTAQEKPPAAPGK